MTLLGPKRESQGQRLNRIFHNQTGFTTKKSGKRVTTRWWPLPVKIRS